MINIENLNKSIIIQFNITLFSNFSLNMNIMI